MPISAGVDSGSCDAVGDGDDEVLLGVVDKVLLVPVGGKDDNAPFSTGLASTVTTVSVSPQV